MGKTQEKGQVKEREKGLDKEDLTARGKISQGKKDADVEALEGQPTLMDTSLRPKNQNKGQWVVIRCNDLWAEMDLWGETSAFKMYFLWVEGRKPSLVAYGRPVGKGMRSPSRIPTS